MAEACSFDESDAVLHPPPGASPEEVSILAIKRVQYEDGSNFVVSCWKLTQVELDEINKTGRVWLAILGNTMPPAVVLGIKPFE